MADDGVHAEAENVAGENGLEEDGGEYGLRDFLAVSAAHGVDGCADAATGEQRDQRHQQQVAGKEERDAAIARAGFGPKQFVAQRDELADEGRVHARSPSMVSSTADRRSISGWAARRTLRVPDKRPHREDRDGMARRGRGADP